MDNIKRVQTNLINGYYQQNPIASANDLSVLAGEYSFICGQLEDILTRKASVWNEIRKNVKSDTSADRAYEATADGLNEQGLRLRMKSVEKMMSSLKSQIQIAEGESRNHY